MSTGSFSSMLSIVAVIFLASFLPGAKADCWIDNNGREVCNGLSNLARAMIGLGFFLLFLSVIYSMFYYRRRRNSQANLAYVQQTQQGGYGGSPYNGPYNGPGTGGPPQFTPQYPPPAHNGLNYPYNYDPSSGFAPPSGAPGAPPQYYAPPPGAPPIRSPK